MIPVARPPRALGTALLWMALGLALLLACQPKVVSQFPHKLHMVDLHCGKPGQPECLSCGSCHFSRAEHEPPAVPKVSACNECHPNDADTQLRAVSQQRTLTPPLAHSIRFSHAKHLLMPAIKGQCIECHKEVAGKTGAMFPPMAQCLGCHEHREQFDTGECGPCHDDHDVKKLLPVTFMAHDLNFVRSHGREATLGGAVCASCHAQRECDDCHDAAQVLAIEMRRPEAFERNFVHPGDFLTRHAFEAKQQAAKCATCHTPPSCDSCHLERGVSANSQSARSPHPPGFMGSNYSAPEFHGRAARRDIVSCAGCHDQGPATNCIDCHRVGAYGGNPHPRGWMGGGTDLREGVCRHCHE